MPECNESYREILDQWRGPVGPGNRITVTVVTEDLTEEVEFWKCLGKVFISLGKNVVEQWDIAPKVRAGLYFEIVKVPEGDAWRGSTQRQSSVGHSLLEGSWSRITVRCSFIWLPSASYLSLVFTSCFFHSSFIFFNGFSWSFSCAL